jgi:hypothetical protein
MGSAARPRYYNKHPYSIAAIGFRGATTGLFSKMRHRLDERRNKTNP